jgi:uncharacterized Tic20 family protein
MQDDRFSPTAKPPAERGVQSERPTAGDRLAPSDGGPTSEERTLALMCHVGGFLTAFILPLILWLLKRRDSAFVDHHGKEALNFQLTLTVAYVLVSLAGIAIGVLYATDNASSGAALVWALACCGFAVLLAFYELLVILLASIASLQGRHFHILGNIRFVR